MADNKSLFARKLRQWRTSHGSNGRVTQEELATLLGVSVDAVGKYERSLSYIRGDLEHRLAERLGWSSEDIRLCRVDWEGSFHSPTKSRYKLLDDAQVDQFFGGSWQQACRSMISMFEAEAPPLPAELAADENVFVPIFDTFRDQWAAVVCDGEIVSNWVLLPLLPEDEDLFRQGRLIESELSVARVRRSVLPGTYFGYCPALVVRPGHEASGALLISSFTRFLETLADREILLHGIGAVSVSPNGAQVCRDFGMTHVGSHYLSPSYEVWELPGERIADSLFTRRSPALRQIYADTFGSSLDPKART